MIVSQLKKRVFSKRFLKICVKARMLTCENHVSLRHTPFRDKMLSNLEQCYVFLLLSFLFPLDMFSVCMALT